MRERDEIERFLRDLETHLPLQGAERSRAVRELRAHLEEAVAQEERTGTSPEDATSHVLARTGDPRRIARQYPRTRPLFDAMVLGGATACGLVAAWLFLVTATVVPQRDPDRLSFWTVVALAYLGYAAFAVAYLRMRDRSRLARWSAVVASIGAVVGGGLLAVPMLMTTGDFEGYVVLMGMILAVQGAVVLTHVATNRRPARIA